MDERILSSSGGEVGPAGPMVEIGSQDIDEDKARLIGGLAADSERFRLLASQHHRIAEYLIGVANQLDAAVELSGQLPELPEPTEAAVTPVEPTEEDPISLDELQQSSGKAGDRKLRFTSPRAKTLIARYLFARPGVIVDSDQLVGHLYSDGIKAAIPREDLRKCVATMLGPKTQGKYIQQILQVEGFVLLYGHRTVRKQTATGIRGVRHRVYRAVKRDELQDKHVARRNYRGTVTTWEVSDEQRSIIEVNKLLQSQTNT